MSDKSLRFLLFGEDRGVGRVMDAAAGAAHTASGKISGAFSKLGSTIGGEFGEVTSKIGEGFAALGEAGPGVGKKFMAAGGAIAGLGVAFQAMGSTRKAAEEQLKAAVEATGQSYEDYKGQIDHTIKSMENFGHGEGDTQLALMKLTAATNDPAKALKDMGLIANLAAAQHEDLATAASQVARVYGGSGKVLKQYGVHLDSAKQATSQLASAEKSHQSAVTTLQTAQQKLSDLERIDATIHKPLSIGQTIALRNAHDAVTKAQVGLKQTTENLTAAQKKSKDSTGFVGDALDQLGQKLEGQAKAKIDTFSGRIDVIKTKLGDWAAMMGGKVGPALTVIGPSLMGVGAILETGLIPKIGAAIASMAGFAASMIAAGASAIASFATMMVQGAIWAAEMAIDGAIALLPFMPIILAVAAVALAAYELYAHWKQIWGYIKDVALEVWHWAEDIFHNKFTQIILAIALPMVFLAVHWKQTWQFIKDIGADAWGYIRDFVVNPIVNVINGVGTGFNKLVNFVAGIPGRIKSAATGMWDGIKDAFRSTINWLIGAWDSLHFSITVPKVHIYGTNIDFGGQTFGFGVPQIPYMADGGIVTKPTLVMAGEAGKEAIIPLSKAGGLLGHGGNGQQIVINLHGVYGNMDTAARELLTALQRLKGQGIQTSLG